MSSYHQSKGSTLIGHSKKRAIDLADKLQGRIAQLGLDSWQQQVYGLIFHQTYKTPIIYGDERIAQERRVAELLEKLEGNERVSLMKLAVWKGQCLLNSDGSLGTYFDYVQWCRVGWKASKQQYKNHSAMNIVVQCVQPFLVEEKLGITTSTNGVKQRRSFELENIFDSDNSSNAASDDADSISD